MTFDDQLRHALKSLMESEMDYENDWEQFRREREQLRKQADADQRQAADAEAQQKLEHDIQSAGGFSNFVQHGTPQKIYGNSWHLLEDVETGNGIILPSLQAKGKDLACFIWWVLIEYHPGTDAAARGGHWQPRKQISEPVVEKVFPFVQFQDDKWPAKDDFDYLSDNPSLSTLATHRDQNYVKRALALYHSDKNHYHMLRGADKHAIDLRVEQAVEAWTADQLHPGGIGPDDYDAYYDED